MGAISASIMGGLAAVGGGSAAAGAVAVGSAAIAVGGTAASVQSSRRAQRAQEKADRISSAQTEIANQRSIRQNVIRSRVQQAQLQAQGQAQTGTFGGSSAVTGALGSAQTQAGANLGFAQTSMAAGGAINRQAMSARRHSSNAATFGAIAQLPGQFGFDLKSVFEGE